MQDDTKRPIMLPRSPLLPLLVGQVCGYALAPLVPVNAASVAAALMLVVAVSVARGARHPALFNRGWSLMAVCAALVVSACYFNLRATELPAPWNGLPEREVTARLRVVRVFRLDKESGAFNGLARIIDENLPADDLRGRLVSLSARPARGDPAGAVERAFDAARHSIVEVRGILDPITEADAAGDAFLRYLTLNRVHFRIRAGRIEGAAAPPEAWRRASHRLYRRIDTALSHPRDNIESRLLRAMTLGRRDLLSVEERERFLATGTAHLFAISGLHVSILAIAVARAMALLRSAPWMRLAVTALITGVYVELTGATPSGQRAWLMVVLFMAARVLIRQGNGFSALVASAVVMLWVDPAQVHSPGFQLSYAVVAMILLYGLPLRMRFAALLDQWKRIRTASNLPMRAGHLHKPSALLAMSIAASLGGTPLSVLHFGVVAPVGVLLNLLLIPTAGFAVLAAALCVMLDLCGLTFAAQVYARAAWFIMRLMNHACALAADTLPQLLPAPNCTAAAAYLCVAMLIALGIGRPLKNDSRAREFWYAPAVVVVFLLAAWSGLITPAAVRQ